MKKLHFYQGDIASYTGRDEVDMGGDAARVRHGD